MTSIRFSPDGKRLLSASYDTTLRIWDVATGKELKRIHAHTPTAKIAAFSPDGRRIVSGGDDDAVRLWDAASGKELRQYWGHGPTVNVMAFFPDGRRIAATSWDGTAPIWRVPRRPLPPGPAGDDASYRPSTLAPSCAAWYTAGCSADSTRATWPPLQHPSGAEDLLPPVIVRVGSERR